MNGIVLQSFIKRNKLNSIRFNKINQRKHGKLGRQTSL